MQYLLDIFFHLDTHLSALTSQYGILTYAILFLIIFCETGLVVTPFLPGDSLLFAAGAIASLGTLQPIALILIISLAAILGDTVNYWIGHHLGPKVFQRESGWFFHRDHLIAAEQFYEKHGGKTIIIARFMPIIRTFAPFVAGIGCMKYGRFIAFNIIGGVLWVGLFVGAGYLFGNIPSIKTNFHYVILGIITLSILPGVYHAVKHRFTKPASPPTPPVA